MRPLLSFLGLSLALTACGGGGSGSHAVPAPKTPVALSIHVSVPVAGALPAARKRALFISPSTQGVAITITPHGAATPVIFTGTFDISSASSLCTTSGATRNCSLSFNVPLGGPYDVAFTTYDAPPVSESFSAATQLGVGTTPNVTVAAGQANAVGVSIGGVVASAFVAPTVTVLRGFHTLAQQVSVGAFDPDGNLIITSGGETYVDASGNAVSIALGASNAGTALTFSPTSIQNSITPVTLTYDAANATGAQIGSGFTATLTATPSNGTTPGQTAVAAAPAVQNGAAIAVVAFQQDIISGPDGRLWATEGAPTESAASRLQVR